MGVKNPFPIFSLMATIWGYPCFLDRQKHIRLLIDPQSWESYSNHNPKRCQNTLETWNIYENMRCIMLHRTMIQVAHVSMIYLFGAQSPWENPWLADVFPRTNRPHSPATSGRCARPAPSPQAMTQQQVTQGMKSFRSTMPW